MKLTTRGVQLGLDRVERVLFRLGDPHRGIPWVVVAGTNGKGSTSAFLAGILRAAGYRVGLYTSPHLVDPRERIRVDGELISKSAFAAQADRVLDAVDRCEDLDLTFFEALTCMAFSHFQHQKIDIGVLEVGLGGRLDAVNVVRPRVSVLTTVALDHREFLGSDLLSIAREKAGILRPRTPVAVAVDDDLFREVIGPRCLEERSPVLKIGRDVLYEWKLGLFSYRGPGVRLQDVSLGLPGHFQGSNAALAVATAEHLLMRGFKISQEAMRRGLVSSRWPGRFEILATDPPFVVDVAHNPHGVGALVRSLRERFGERRWSVCVAAKKEKDLAGMLRQLAPVAADVTVAGTAADGFATLDTLDDATRAELPELQSMGELGEAIAVARGRHARGEATLITGSHRLAGLTLTGGLS